MAFFLRGEMIKSLSTETARLLSSSQVAISPEVVVKELIENSLDAGSSAITIKIKDGGLALISITDNGSGIRQDDVPLVLQRHATSKIESIDDLQHVQSYGFRGEALNSIATVSAKIIVSTRMEDEEIGRCYEFNSSHDIASISCKSMQCGTQIDVERLFHNVPVRRKYFSDKSNLSCRKIRDLVNGYALLFFKVRFSLRIEKTVNSSMIRSEPSVLNKPQCTSVLEAIRAVFGTGVSKLLDCGTNVYRIEDEENCSMSIEAVLPKRCVDDEGLVWKSNSDLTFVFINSRRVSISDSTLLKEIISRLRTRILKDTHKFPFAFIHIQLPVCLTDVNIETDKSKVQITCVDDTLLCLETLLDQMYPQQEESTSTSNTEFPALIQTDLNRPSEALSDQLPKNPKSQETTKNPKLRAPNKDCPKQTGLDLFLDSKKPRQSKALESILHDFQCNNMSTNQICENYQLMKKQGRQVRCNSDISPIGRVLSSLAGGSLISSIAVRQGGQIHLVNAMRVQEILHFENLCETLEVSITPLSTPIALTKELVGGLHLLQHLSAFETDENTRHITDKRIKYNGFDVVSDDAGFKLVGLATSVRSLDVKDLNEILERFHRNNKEMTLYESRPLKIIDVIKAKASFLAKHTQEGLLPDEQVEEAKKAIAQLLNGTEGVLRNRVCPHGEPAILSIFKDTLFFI